MPVGTTTTPILSKHKSSHNSSALHQLLSPDGYYTYLQIPKSSSYNHKPMMNEGYVDSSNNPKSPATSISSSTNNSMIPDKELIIKNYRKLSLKHHPDRKGGDTETFRVLNRAKRVLTHEKLRQQYDLLGFDLEDEEEKDTDDEQEVDEEEEEEEEEKEQQQDKKEEVDDMKKKHVGDETHTHTKFTDTKKKKSKTKSTSTSSSTTDTTVLNQLASSTLAFLFQLAIRTTMMGFVSTFISSFLWTLIPFELLLLVTALRIYLDKRRSSSVLFSSFSISWIEILSPLLIALGVYCMYQSRMNWGWKYWFGETLVMTLFIYNSLFHNNNPHHTPSTPIVALRIMVLLYIGCSILTLLLRGKWGRYAMIVGIQLFLALIAVIAFPMMEMLLEQMLQEKLRKIGDKVRSQAKRLDELRRSENDS